MAYVVYRFVPYENESEVFRCDTEEELVDWFRHRDKDWYPADDLSIYSTEAPTVEELKERVKNP